VNPVRIGIVGCGNVLSAYWVECQKLAASGEAEVVAACGRQSQRELVVDRLGVQRFVTDYGELVASSDVDLVVVLTPPATHFEITRAALRAGKHVLAEKPLAMTLAEADELVELAARGPGLFAPAPFTLLSPTYQAIARRIRHGDIGKPCSARGRYGWSGPWWSEWFYRAGGGPLFDLACYNITSLTGWLGPVERVTALVGTAIAERLVNGKPVQVTAEDNAQVLLDFGEACFAVVTSGFVMQQYRSPALEVYGTDGTLQMLGDDWNPDGYEFWQNAAGCWQVYQESAPDWRWADGLRHLVECIRSKAPPIITARHARHVLEVILAAQASARDGTVKVVTSRFEPPEFPDVDSSEPAHLVHDRNRTEFKNLKHLSTGHSAMVDL
jgi:predicted dehydrogenase